MKLDELRKQIDEIDKNMASLFEKRMKIVEEIGRFKKENGLEILDEAREKQVIDKNLNYIEEDRYKGSYQEFLVSLMNIAKKLEK